MLKASKETINNSAERYYKQLINYLVEGKQGNIVYMEKSNKVYKEVTADIFDGKIVCAFIDKNRTNGYTKTYKFILTPQLFAKALMEDYANKADLFMMNINDMSQKFVLNRINMFMDNMELEEQFIFGTGVYMCALYVQDHGTEYRAV